MTSYDIIGDIHGHAAELRSLLMSLGYQRHGDGFQRSDRKVVFVGDFVDRGPAIGEVVKIARAMIDAGDALAVMGNHEYNAIAFHTPRLGKQGEWFRPHSEKNLKQHQATLDQLTLSELADAIAWFKTLPVPIEIGKIRVAHASWQIRDIDCINIALVATGRFTPDFLAMSEDSGSDLNNAIENVLKGPEFA
ncbi:metallophosphoesterase [bacterium]|nr:metallophosphoesterase [bacterium]